MIRKLIFIIALSSTLLVVSGCHHKVQNPLANVNSKQPDKTLFDKAMDSMKHGRYQESRTLLETLINTYPDSEYIARAKLAMGDAWYAEGGTAAWAQADEEYRSFITFFPNLPEAAEAQLKIASMHYRQMEKPDRDFSQAVRAAEEYRNLIQNFPDSSLVPEAKQKLREVQEVLAERQYKIAHFYNLRENLAAAQARLQSLIDSYPLYSGADQALFELGGLYEREAEAVRRQKAPEALKERLVAQFEKNAINAYSRIVTRYPAMGRAEDARSRLQALKAPVPVPTADAIAASKAEEQSRKKISMTQKVLWDFKKRPNIARSTQIGEPPLKEEEVINAADLVKDLNNQMSGLPSKSVGVEAVGAGSGTPGPNQPAPSSQSGDAGTAPPPAPPQVNEVQGASTPNAQDGSAAPAKQGSADPKQESSSKKKGKKGLRKLIPF